MGKAPKTGRERHPFFQQEYALQLEMVRPSKQLLEVPPTPPGYLLRQFRPGDEEEYDVLFHKAFEDRSRFPEIVERTLPGGFFVVEDLTSRELVSSCLAMRGGSSPRHRGAGQLGWLVTDPAHTGKGLGTLVSASATDRLARQGYHRPFLGTEDLRTDAISIYVKLGWRPYIYSGSMESRWCNVFSRVQLGCEPTFVWLKQSVT